MNEITITAATGTIIEIERKGRLTIRLRESADGIKISECHDFPTKLTQDDVAQLLPYLTTFAKTGKLLS